jgi:hypothetical protein
MSMEELANVKGRGWEDIDVRGVTLILLTRWNELTSVAALVDPCIIVSITGVWNERSSDSLAYTCTALLGRLGGMHYTYSVRVAEACTSNRFRRLLLSYTDRSNKPSALIA